MLKCEMEYYEYNQMIIDEYFEAEDEINLSTYCEEAIDEYIAKGKLEDYLTSGQYNIIKQAIEYEIKSIKRMNETDDIIADRNPHANAIKSWRNGASVWEVINEIVENYFA